MAGFESYLRQLKRPRVYNVCAFYIYTNHGFFWGGGGILSFISPPPPP